MQTFIDTILRILFEKIPVLNWFNGRKEKIGAWLIVLAVTLEGFRQVMGVQFPEIDLALGNLSLEQLIAGLGVVASYVGARHQAAKLREEK